MDVLYKIIHNSSLNGMPKWYKAVSLLLFSTIVVLLGVILVLLTVYGSQMNIRFGY